MSWLTVLKVLPWGDMIEHAPRLVGGAQKLWQRIKSENAETGASVIEQMPLSENDAARELQELKQQLKEVQTQQLELSNLVSELAAQNQRLVNALEMLRLRTRILLWLSAGFGVVFIYLIVKR